MPISEQERLIAAAFHSFRSAKKAEKRVSPSQERLNEAVEKRVAAMTTKHPKDMTEQELREAIEECPDTECPEYEALMVEAEKRELDF